MELLTDRKLADVLRGHNPWWGSGAMPHGLAHTQARPGDAALLDATRPTLLFGPRRCGKTATLFRIVDGSLRAGLPPRRIAYLPLDHPLLRLVPLGPLVDRVCALLEPNERPLLLLDGLQAVADWPRRFAEVVRTRPAPRILAAASVRPEGDDPAFETATLPTFRFREFCDARGVPDLGAPPLDPFEPGGPRIPGEGNAADDYLFDRVLDPSLADYLVRGGFPEAVRTPDLLASQRAVRDDVVARAVYQDLPGVAGVEKVGEVERVLLAALAQGGQPIVVEAFADALELDAKTVGRYLVLLERAFLLTELRNFAATTDRSRPRYFPADPALPNALLERGAAVLGQPEERGSLLVGAVVAHVTAAARARGFDVAYFREGDLEAEVAVVTPEGAIPIVVFDREEAGEAEAAHVQRTMRRLGARTAFLLSRARPRRKEPLTFFESVVHLPAAYFLYALR